MEEHFEKYTRISGVIHPEQERYLSGFDRNLLKTLKKAQPPKLRPNAPCPCSSGKKYKNCHKIIGARAKGVIAKLVEKERLKQHHIMKGRCSIGRRKRGEDFYTRRELWIDKNGGLLCSADPGLNYVEICVGVLICLLMMGYFAGWLLIAQPQQGAFKLNRDGVSLYRTLE